MEPALAATSLAEDALDLLARISGMPVLALTQQQGNAFVVIASIDRARAGVERGAVLGRSSTFCHVAVRSAEPIVIDDAHSDPRYRRHRAFLRHRVRSYVGVRISREPFMIGTLCAMSPLAHVGLEHLAPHFAIVARLLSAEPNCRSRSVAPR
jgi:GAF domain-containing protein